MVPSSVSEMVSVEPSRDQLKLMSMSSFVEPSSSQGIVPVPSALNIHTDEPYYFHVPNMFPDQFPTKGSSDNSDVGSHTVSNK